MEAVLRGFVKQESQRIRIVFHRGSLNPGSPFSTAAAHTGEGVAGKQGRMESREEDRGDGDRGWRIEFTAARFGLLH